MTKKYVELAEEYIREHAEKGQWSPFDRFERGAMQFFAEWLDKRATVEPSGEPDYRHLYECEKASKAVLQYETDSLKADLHAMTNAAVTLDALKTAHQALLEVAHAQDAGPEWYTRGASALRQQVAMWVRRGLDALNKARPTENRDEKP